MTSSVNVNLLTADLAKTIFDIRYKQVDMVNLSATNDNTATIQAQMNAAAPYTVLRMPAGRWAANNDTLVLRNPDVEIRGYGNATITSNNPDKGGFRIEGNRCKISGVKHVITGATIRGSIDLDMSPWSISGADGVVLEDVLSRGSKSAGIFVYGATNFKLIRCRVEKSLADGIHMTHGAAGGVVSSPVVRDSGDDGVAVVSYNDTAICSDIYVDNINVANAGARGVSIVGGLRIDYSLDKINRTWAGAVYIADEPGYNSWPVTDCTVSGGEIIDANWGSADKDNGAIGLFTLTSGLVMKNVKVQNIEVKSMRGRGSTSDVQYCCAKNSNGAGGRFDGCVIQDIWMHGNATQTFPVDGGLSMSTVADRAYNTLRANTDATKGVVELTTSPDIGFAVYGSSSTVAASTTTQTAPGLKVIRVRMGGN